MFDSRFFRTLCFSCLSIPTLWILPVNTMAQAPSNPGRAEPAAEDPYEWLEEVLGDKALEWVKARNAIVQNRTSFPTHAQALGCEAFDRAADRGEHPHPVPRPGPLRRA